MLETLDVPFKKTISPLTEMAAYEAIWLSPNATYKRVADIFRKQAVLPSEYVRKSEVLKVKQKLLAHWRESDFVSKPSLLINQSFDYPTKLRDAKHPVELIYYQGDLDRINEKSVAIVGTRNPTSEGVRRAKKLVKLLVKDGYTIVSGLAKGIDTVVHSTALEVGGRTIAVIGTPLSSFYPRENADLQKNIAKEHLLISPVPFLRYEAQDYRINRGFFPERNKTMSALTEATIIVEASDTSGTLTQARAALFQRRRLFILDSCFRNNAISWPERFAKQGAIRVQDYADIKSNLQ